MCEIRCRSGRVQTRYCDESRSVLAHFLNRLSTEYSDLAIQWTGLSARTHDDYATGQARYFEHVRGALVRMLLSLGEWRTFGVISRKR